MSRLAPFAPLIAGGLSLGVAAVLMRQGARLPAHYPLLGQDATTKTRFQRVAGHPFTFGTGAGLVAGTLAAVREKKVSLLANVVTAMVVGIAEGLLVEDPKRTVSTALFAALGHTLGMAPFTRWQASRPALIENRPHATAALPAAMPAYAG